MEYQMTAAEQKFVITLRATLIQAKANIHEAQVKAREAEQVLQKATSEATAVQATFDGALKMLMNAHDMQTATLSADCGRLTGE